MFPSRGLGSTCVGPFVELFEIDKLLMPPQVVDATVNFFGKLYRVNHVDLEFVFEHFELS